MFVELLTSLLLADELFFLGQKLAPAGSLVTLAAAARLETTLLDAGVKLCSLLGFLVVVLLFDELTNFCDASLFDFFCVVDSLEQILAERRVKEKVKVLRVDQAFHNLKPNLFNVVPLRAEPDHPWQVKRRGLQTRVVLISKFLLPIPHALSDCRCNFAFPLGMERLRLSTLREVAVGARGLRRHFKVISHGIGQVSGVESSRAILDRCETLRVENSRADSAQALVLRT